MEENQKKEYERKRCRFWGRVWAALELYNECKIPHPEDAEVMTLKEKRTLFSRTPCSVFHKLYAKTISKTTANTYDSELLDAIISEEMSNIEMEMYEDDTELSAVFLLFYNQAGAEFRKKLLWYRRVKCRASQEKVAKYMGVSQATVNNIENGKVQPDEEYLEKIEKFFEENKD